MLKPNRRLSLSSATVVSTYPSPDAIARVDDAPELPQPVAAVFVKLFPDTVTPTAFVQTTASTGPGVGVGVGVGLAIRLPEMTTFWIVAPVSSSAVSTSSG